MRGLWGLVACACLAACSPSRPESSSDITSQLWTLSADAGDITLLLDADVPGCVTQSLVKTGLIPDPYKGTHERDAQWVEQLPWTYSTTLARPQGWPAMDSLVITFSNLVTYAKVRLDGVTILKADNAHRTHCSQPFVLNKKEHELTVTLARWRQKASHCSSNPTSSFLQATNQKTLVFRQVRSPENQDTNLVGLGTSARRPRHHG